MRKLFNRVCVSLMAAGLILTISFNESWSGVSAQIGRKVPEPANGAVLPFVIINEVDSDTPGADTAEFVELYDGGVGNTPLDGYVVVFFNGDGEVSYRAIDLDGRTTDADGYFVIGNTAVPNVDLTFPNGTLQNGADAVALYIGNATDFPTGTAVTTTNLFDAIVYDTSDADAPGLLVLLNADQPQVDENEDTFGDTESMQRCPNGFGRERNTYSYDTFLPTPGAVNSCPGVTAAGVNITGRITTADGRGIANVRLTLLRASTGAVKTALTSTFGYYTFEDVEVGEGYVISVKAKRYSFAGVPRFITVTDELTEVNFIGEQ